MIHNICAQPVTSITEHPDYMGYNGSPILGNYCHECSVSVSYEEIWFGSEKSYINHKRGLVQPNLHRDNLQPNSNLRHEVVK